MLIDLLQLQFASEDAWGSVEPPTHALAIADGEVTPKVENVQLKQMMGTLVPGYTTITPKISGEGNLTIEALTYEELALLFDMLFSEASPEANEALWDRAWAAPLDEISTPRYISLVIGDPDDAYSLTSAHLSKLTITGESGSPWSAKADLLGQVVDLDALEVDLPVYEVNPIFGGECTLTIGAVPITGAAFSFELAVDTKRALQWRLGSKYPVSCLEVGKWAGTMKVSVDYASGQDMIEAALEDAQSGLITIDATDGTEIAQIKFYGTLLEVPKFFEAQDGIVSAELNLSGQFDGTLTNWLVATSTSALALVP